MPPYPKAMIPGRKSRYPSNQLRSNTDHQDDHHIRHDSGLNRNTDRKITGIILRSQVVPGWPNLLIDGYDQSVQDLDSIDPSEANLLPLLRMEKLSNNVLICLFETIEQYSLGRD